MNTNNYKLPVILTEDNFDWQVVNDFHLHANELEKQQFVLILASIFKKYTNLKAIKLFIDISNVGDNQYYSFAGEIYLNNNNYEEEINILIHNLVVEKFSNNLAIFVNKHLKNLGMNIIEREKLDLLFKYTYKHNYHLFLRYKEMYEDDDDDDEGESLEDGEDGEDSDFDEADFKEVNKKYSWHDEDNTVVNLFEDINEIEDNDD